MCMIVYLCFNCTHAFHPSPFTQRTGYRAIVYHEVRAYVTWEQVLPLKSGNRSLPPAVNTTADVSDCSIISGKTDTDVGGDTLQTCICKPLLVKSPEPYFYNRGRWNQRVWAAASCHLQEFIIFVFMFMYSCFWMLRCCWLLQIPLVFLLN